MIAAVGDQRTGSSRSSVHTLETIVGKPVTTVKTFTAVTKKGRNRILEEALAQDPIFGRRNYHRRSSLRMARLANRAGLGSMSANLGRCSRQLGVTPEGKLVARDACHSRHCNFCQGTKAMRWAGRLHEAMPQMRAEHPTWRFLLFTVTEKNVSFDKINETTLHLHESFARMTKRKAFAPTGVIRNTELTVSFSRANIGAHIHAHLLCCVDDSYFDAPWRKVKGENGRPRIVPGYMTQPEWRELWKQCARLDYDPVVDIRAIPGHLDKSAARKAVYEITKYAAKPADILSLSPKQFALYHEQIHGTRSIGVNGVLSPYVRAETVQDPPADVPQVMTWNDAAKRYLIDGSPEAHQWARYVERERLLATWQGPMPQKAIRQEEYDEALRRLQRAVNYMVGTALDRGEIHAPTLEECIPLGQRQVQSTTKRRHDGTAKETAAQRDT